MTKRENIEVNSRRRSFVLFSAASILLIAWSVLIFGFPPGMETGAALLLVTPFAMCIFVVESSNMAGREVANRIEE
jgi:hypothetical protein